ncbi:LemA family protein (plasmid) [Leptolyngbya sp. NIES-3755]|nr:LemA family protein [Leptolyngbya sp. NIES-3755]
MNDPDARISKEQFPEVFALAARLQAQHEQSYSLTELTQIGQQAHLKPEFIEQAVQQLQAKQSQAQTWRQMLKAGIMSVGIVTAFWGILIAHTSLAQTGCGSMMSRSIQSLNQTR